MTEFAWYFSRIISENDAPAFIHQFMDTGSCAGSRKTERQSSSQHDGAVGSFHGEHPDSKMDSFKPNSVFHGGEEHGIRSGMCQILSLAAGMVTYE